MRCSAAPMSDIRGIFTVIVYLGFIVQSAAFTGSQHFTFHGRCFASILDSGKETLFDDIRSEDIEGDVARLPIYSILDPIRESLRDKPNLLLEAAPGAGKTTVVPLLLCTKNIARKVIVVEPRRVATRSAAHRMSKLIGQPVGESVGYAVRGESKQSPNTSILVMTDGVLLTGVGSNPIILMALKPQLIGIAK
jgi:HrpA-like RNA helicase